MSDRYDTDILLWSERQAELLRRSAAGERVNDGELDWPNIVDEIEDVGRSELRSCRSLLRQALRQMLKAEAWSLSRDAPTWRADAIDFRRQAKDAFTPSMRQKIDVAGLYRDALQTLPKRWTASRLCRHRPRCRRWTRCCARIDRLPADFRPCTTFRRRA